MRTFDELVTEGAEAEVGGWDFGWLDGRATEQRPPWGYSSQLAQRLATSACALDFDTGGGEILAEMPALPPTMCATESWPPNVQRARGLLGPRGVEVVQSGSDAQLPFAPESFDLVVARHPVRPPWTEIRRVLRPGGRYFAQHVGPESAFELIEQFVDVTADDRTRRDPRGEVTEAEAAGLTVTDVRTARCRMEFFDIGAVVYILRKCVWWVPGFDVDTCRTPLRRVDDVIRAEGSFVAHSTRHLIEARR